MSNKRVQAVRYEITNAQALAGRVNAADVARELEAVYKQHGSLTAENVLSAAYREDSALHGAFTWDNDAAAGKWRLHQARNLIRSVRVVKDDSKPRSVYVHTGKDEAYQPIERVVSVPDLFASALSEAQARIVSAVAATEELKEAANLRPKPEAERLAKISMALSALETARSVALSLH